MKCRSVDHSRSLRHLINRWRTQSLTTAPETDDGTRKHCDHQVRLQVFCRTPPFPRAAVFFRRLDDEEKPSVYPCRVVLLFDVGLLESEVCNLRRLDAFRSPRRATTVNGRYRRTDPAVSSKENQRRRGRLYCAEQIGGMAPATCS